MKKISISLLLCFCITVALAKGSYLDSLEQILDKNPAEDTSRVLALFPIADYYGFIQYDKCFYYASQIDEISQKLNYSYGKFLGAMSTFHALNSEGNYSRALEVLVQMQKLAEEVKDQRPWTITEVYYFFGLLNREMSNYNESKIQFGQSIAWQKKNGEPPGDVFATYSQLGIVYARQHQLDTALYYAEKGYTLGLHASNQFKIYFPLAIGALGNINVSLGRFAEAGQLYHEAIRESGTYDNVYFEARNYNNLASMFDAMNLRDSCIYYARISLSLCIEHNFAEFTLDASTLLTRSYELQKRQDSAYKYLKIMGAAKDSVFSQSKVQQFEQSAFDELRRQQEISIERERYQNRIRIYVLLASLGVFLLIAFILYRSSRQKQKAKIKIEKAYADLKSAQVQLVQSEKMASLGELTAGIAHEIQNPLNFVNNFSDLNAELLEEMKEEIQKGNYKDAASIADDIIDNEQKINHHGKRADAIVKGMLQHSRSSTGQKVPTDINELADEFLRLSYHGLRAKEKSFNAIIKTDYDNSIGKINIVSQDIGRVLLNIYNNAFYAVDRKSMANRSVNGTASTDPTVTVITRAIKISSGSKGVEIKVIDNGNGIPQKVLDKIFQPFFTTKPTGQGTGLGLSLSYDIIKAHGGEIQVETKEGEFTEFRIVLPA